MTALDRQARAIIAQAAQANLRRVGLADDAFKHIFRDFLPVDLNHQVLVDLGPGHYDFARMAQRRGAACDNIDKDPAVIALGRYLGFRVIEANLATFDPRQYPRQYDGLFCKGSINVHWHKSAADAGAFVHALDGMLKPAGWGFVAPWNGGAGEAGRARALRAAQESAFVACGWSVVRPDRHEARYYGVAYEVDESVIFTRNLRRGAWRAWLARLPVLWTLRGRLRRGLGRLGRSSQRVPLSN